MSFDPGQHNADESTPDSGVPGPGTPEPAAPAPSSTGTPGQPYSAPGAPGQPYSAPGAPGQGYPAQGSTGTDASLAHYLNLLGVLGPLIYWLATKDQSPVSDREGKTALNWALTVLVGAVVLSALTWIPFLGLLFSLALGALYIVNAVFAIIGGLQASRTGTYVYPFSISFLS